MSPTVLLVHGAFADGSSWSKVIGHLHEHGVAARTIANPLRGLSSDGDYVASVIAQTQGDVVLVGHSYGGAVITHAASAAANVKALVYVAAYTLDHGETAQGSTAGYPDSALASALQPWTYPGSELPELTIQPDKYRHAFAADVTDDEARAGAANQRAAAALGLTEPLAVEPAWKSAPSWWVIGTEDNAIPPDYQRDRAKKIGATITELHGGSHSIAVSRADDVAAVILDAVRAIS